MIFREGSEDPTVYHSKVVTGKRGQEYLLLKYTLASHWNLMDEDYMGELTRIEFFLFDNLDEELNVLAKGKTNKRSTNFIT